MNDLEEFIYINELYEIYGSLLSKSQIIFMDSYYKFNLSLSEIAEERNISRSAVSDAINKAKEKLLYYESHLHISANNNKIRTKINNLEIDDEIKKEILEDL